MAGRISRDTIDEVKNRIDIVDVIGDFVSLKRSGQTYKALSPFTNEKTASFFVVPSKGIFKDFSSGKGGDAITFVMEHEGIGYQEAIRHLARKYGVEIHEEEGKPDQPESDRDSLYIMMNFAREYYQRQLNDTEEGKSIGKSYFHERGFTENTIRKFELGYAVDAWDALMKEATGKGFSKEVLEKTGLILTNENGKTYDRFRGRAMFPIHNLAGKVIGFGARILTRDKNQPKYVNSPETEIYHKSNVLYGMFQAKNSIRRFDFCYLVEGYTDVISLHQAGIDNVVASSGTALTEEQIKQIGRFTENVTVLYDGDEAGVKAALRGVDLILKGGLNVRVVMLPDGDDPDSFARKKSSTEVQDYLKGHAQDFLSFKISLFAADAASDPIRKAELVKDIVESIAIIPDPLKRSIYIQECSTKLDVPPGIIAIEIKKLVLRRRRNEEPAKEEKEGLQASLADVHTLSKSFLLSPEQTLVEYERELIKVLLLFGQEKNLSGTPVYEQIFHETDDVTYVDKKHQDIVDRYRAALLQDESFRMEDFIKSLPDELRNYIAEFVIQKYEISEGWKKHKIYVGDEYDLNEAPLKAIMQLKLGIIQKMLSDNLEKLKTTRDKAEEEGLLEVQYKIDQYKNAVGIELGRIVFNSAKLQSSI